MEPAATTPPAESSTLPSSPPRPSGSGSLTTVTGFLLGGVTLVEAMPHVFENEQPMWARIVAAGLCAGVAFHPSVSIALIDKVGGIIGIVRGGGK